MVTTHEERLLWVHLSYSNVVTIRGPICMIILRLGFTGHQSMDEVENNYLSRFLTGGGNIPSTTSLGARLYDIELIY